MAGLGNIYVDEALHLARLHPLRRSDTLSQAEVHALWRGIRLSLQRGLRHHGASIDWVYRGGDSRITFASISEPASRARSVAPRSNDW